jgi:hypothetical protein
MTLSFQEYLLLAAVLAAVNNASRRLWRWPDGLC